MVQAQLLGRLTRDCETRMSSNNKTICQFAIACDSGFAGQKVTSFFNCTAFGKIGDNIAKFFKKGSMILLDCEPRQNVFTDKNGNKRNEVVFIVNKWDFVGSNRDTSEATEEATQGATDAFVNIPDGVSDDGLPFN